MLINTVARCSPVCRRGTREKAISSDRRAIISRGPCDVFLVWESVQWPVIAINDMRFESLQQSAVNEIFPSALYIINKRMKQYK